MYFFLVKEMLEKQYQDYAVVPFRLCYLKTAYGFVG